MMKRTLITILFAFLFLNSNAQQPAQLGNGIIYDVCYSNNGSVIFVAENRAVNIYSTKNHQLLNSLNGQHQEEILSIDISGDSTLCVSADQKGMIVLWDLNTMRPLQKLRYHENAVTSLKISPDNKYLISGSADRSVIIYDIESDKHSKIEGYSKDVTAITVHPGGNMFAVGTGSGRIDFVGLRKKKKVKTIYAHINWIRDLEFISQGRKLLSCGDDGLVRIWNTENIDNFYLLKELSSGLSWQLTLDYFKPGAIATGGLNKELQVYTNNATLSYKAKSIIQDVEFMPNQKKMVIAVATRGNGVLLIKEGQMEIK